MLFCRYSLLLLVKFVPSLCLGAGHNPNQVSSDDVSRFQYWAQYAAAAYCESTFANPSGGLKIVCDTGNCPDVEDADPEVLLSITEESTLGSAFVARDDTNRALVVSIRGAESVRSKIADRSDLLVPIPFCSSCQASVGIWETWLAVNTTILNTLATAHAQNSDYEVVVVGHSHGAAVATLAASSIRHYGYSTTCYTFGSPRVLNGAFADFITAQGKNYRFTHVDDAIPIAPPSWLGYEHVRPEYRITSPGNVTVTAADIEVREISAAGSLLDIFRSVILNSDVHDAHRWYFQWITSCSDHRTRWR